MRIVTLIENLVYKQGLVAEHGLSFYLETGHKKILFDTGQSANFLSNAQALGIDLREIDIVVISHGHYDHTGGLYPFLKINSKAEVYIKKEAFLPKFHGTERFIGITYDAGLLDSRIHYVSGNTEIDKGVFIMAEIPIKNPLDINYGNFKIKTPDGYANDEFMDELYLAIRQKERLSVISSCSHRGITNIMEAAFNQFRLRLHLVLGGFHIKDCRASQSEVITMYLERFSVDRIGICHCTGVTQYAELLGHFHEKVFYNHTGYEIALT